MADCENRSVIKLADLHTGLEPVQTGATEDTTAALALIDEVKSIILELDADCREDSTAAHAIAMICSSLRYLAAQFST